MLTVKVVGLRVALTMMEAMGHVNDSKGGGRGIDGVTSRPPLCSSQFRVRGVVEQL